MEVVWDNLPIHVNSTVTVQNRMSGVEGAEWSDAKTLSATHEYWPDCDYRVGTPTFSAALVSNDPDIAFGDHKLSLNSAVVGEYGYYCPGFTSEITYYFNGNKQMSVALTPDQTSSFFQYGTDYTGAAVKNTQTIDFTEGEFCIDF